MDEVDQRRYGRASLLATIVLDDSEAIFTLSASEAIRVRGEVTTLTTWCLEMCPNALRLAAQANKASKRAAGFWTIQYTYHDDCIAATASATCEVSPYEYLSDYHDLGSTPGRLPCRQLGAVGSF